MWTSPIIVQNLCIGVTNIVLLYNQKVNRRTARSHWLKLRRWLRKERKNGKGNAWNLKLRWKMREDKGSNNTVPPPTLTQYPSHPIIEWTLRTWSPPTQQIGQQCTSWKLPCSHTRASSAQVCTLNLYKLGHCQEMHYCAQADAQLVQTKCTSLSRLCIPHVQLLQHLVHSDCACLDIPSPPLFCTHPLLHYCALIHNKTFQFFTPLNQKWKPTTQNESLSFKMYLSQLALLPITTSFNTVSTCRDKTSEQCWFSTQKSESPCIKFVVQRGALLGRPHTETLPSFVVVFLAIAEPSFDVFCT